MDQNNDQHNLQTQKCGRGKQNQMHDLDNNDPTQSDRHHENDAVGSSDTPATEEPEPAQATPDPQADAPPENDPPFDTLTSLARLITGLAIEGSLELISILQEAEKASTTQQSSHNEQNKELTTAEQIRFIALGMMTESMQQTRKMVEDMTRIGTDMSEKWAAQLNPLHDNFLVRPVKQRYFAFLEQGNATLKRWLETGQQEEAHSRNLARSATGQAIDQIVNYLEQSDSAQDLIREQADTYLQFLADNPDSVRALVNNEVDAYLSKIEGNPAEMERLIQKLADQYVVYIRENPALMNALVEEQADQYLIHLQENPELMQAVIQDQSLSMAGEMIDEVRERTVTIDGLMERLARKVLRREPRTALTPPQVRRLADYHPHDSQSTPSDTE